MSECICDNGCPACVGPAAEVTENGKYLAQIILGGILGDTQFEEQADSLGLHDFKLPSPEKVLLIMPLDHKDSTKDERTGEDFGGRIIENPEGSFVHRTTVSTAVRRMTRLIQTI